jgi:hypothetical protein
MRRTVGVALALLVLLPAARALDDAKPPGTPAEQYKALVKEYQDATNAFQKAMREAKTNEERVKAMQLRPNAQKFAERFLALAEKHPKDPAAVDALVWVATHTGGSGKGSPRAAALAALARDHATSDKLGPLCDALSRGFDKENLDTLRAVLKKNPHADVKAAACMALGTQLQTRANIAGRLDGNEQLAKQVEQVLGKDALEELKKKGEAGLNKEAEALFERVVKEFPDAKDSRGNKLGPLAEGKLLGPGRAAPEIDGEDTDGKAFKLSDYKGKVVLLDFWGNW